MIKITGLKKSFDKNVVFDGFDLTVEGPGFYALSGPSGSGKTTLLRIISGLDRDYTGKVEVSGVISYVFQENRLMPSVSAYDNVFEVCHDRELTSYLLDAVGLPDAGGKYPSELSGGMARRVAIARALSYPHGILLLDEPFTALDAGVKSRIISLVKHREQGKTVIAVTHDPSESEALGCTVIELKK